MDFSLLDAINLGDWSYIGGALFYLVRFKASNYMALPVQFIAIVNLLVFCTETLAPRLLRKATTQRVASGIRIGCSIALVAIENGLTNTFAHQVKDITSAHDSWTASLATVDGVTKKSHFNCKKINLIFNKVWVSQ